MRTANFVFAIIVISVGGAFTLIDFLPVIGPAVFASWFGAQA